MGITLIRRQIEETDPPNTELEQSNDGEAWYPVVNGDWTHTQIRAKNQKPCRIKIATNEPED